MPAPKGNTNSTKHFMHSEVDKLPQEKIARLAELREMVASNEGRLEAREELAARCLLIVDLGFSYLAEKHKAGENIWQLDPIKRLQGYIAESRRLLDSFAELPPGLDAEAERVGKVIDAQRVRKVIDVNTKKDSDRTRKNGSADS